MRISAFVVGVVVAAMPALAHADQREDLQAKGERLAKAGQYAEAIDAFKEADRITPRASHACLIALAYTRRELWPQAELFLALCKDRAKPGDPLPGWVPVAERQLRDRMLGTDLVEVSIETKPAATITISTFAADETFAPRTIHLAPGTHVISARAGGYQLAEQTVVIKDKTPVRVVLELKRDAPGVTAPLEPLDPTTREQPPTREQPGRTLLILGAVTVGVGGLAHLWLGFERSQLVKARESDNRTLYDAHSRKFDIALYSTIGLYTVGAALVVTGFVVRRKGRREPTAVSALPIEGGAIVTLGWQR